MTCIQQKRKGEFSFYADFNWDKIIDRPVYGDRMHYVTAQPIKNTIMT